MGLRTVFKNPDLRRVQLAFVGSTLGDWTDATAVTVWAYSAGGGTAVGVFPGVRRFISVAVASPLGAGVADRVPRRRFMMVRAVLVLAAMACVALHARALFIYALALLCSVVGAPFRSAQAGLMPTLAGTPEELTSSNATAGTLENAASFAGPALGALPVAVADVDVVFALNSPRSCGRCCWCPGSVSGNGTRRESSRLRSRQPTRPVSSTLRPGSRPGSGRRGRWVPSHRR